MSGAPRAALLTGEKGAGKTTICLSLAAESRLFSGILEIPILDAEGRMIGINARSLSGGEEWELARSDRDLGGPTTRRFSFSQDALERALRAAEESLGRLEGITIIDEVGPLELEDGAGLAPILHRLASAGNLLLVVRPALLARLAPWVPRHHVEVVGVSSDSRGEALERLRVFFK